MLFSTLAANLFNIAANGKVHYLILGAPALNNAVNQS